MPSVSMRPFVAVTPVCLPCPSLQDFVSGLSIILRGTIDDRLNWAFNLYDLNKDGCITKEVGWGGSRLVPRASAGLHPAGTRGCWVSSGEGLGAVCQYLLSSALQTGPSWPPGTGVSLGWRVDEARAALALHHTCRHTHGHTLCMEPAGTQLSTPQLLREHHEKGVGWGPGRGRALC